jgi:hypothetical protein
LILTTTLAIKLAMAVAAAGLENFRILFVHIQRVLKTKVCNVEQTRKGKRLPSHRIPFRAMAPSLYTEECMSLAIKLSIPPRLLEDTAQAHIVKMNSMKTKVNVYMRRLH